MPIMLSWAFVSLVVETSANTSQQNRWVSWFDNDSSIQVVYFFLRSASHHVVLSGIK